MLLHFIAVGTASLMMTSAASAQQTQTPTEAPATAPVAEPATPATPASPAQPPAQSAKQNADTTAQVQQLVSTEFPKFDTDKSGDLSEAEFTKWVMDLRSKAEEGDPNAPKADAVAKAQWAKNAFAKADSNKDQKADQSEMTVFFSEAQ